MERDPVLYSVLTTNYDGEVIDSTVHLFGYDGEIVWSRYSEGKHYFNPHDELGEQLQLGNEAFGRLYCGEFTDASG